jgi:hypothetical protein
MSSEQEGSALELGGAIASAKVMVLVLGLVFAVTLAIVVGKQMSTEAMAVVVGVVCGVAAGIPTSVLLLAALNRRERHRKGAGPDQEQKANYPPVVVVQGGGQAGLPPAPQAGYWPMAAPGPAVHRQFNVVGGDDILMDDGRY